MKTKIEVNGFEMYAYQLNRTFYIETPFRATSKPNFVDAIDNVFKLKEIRNKINGTSIMLFTVQAAKQCEVIARIKEISNIHLNHD